VALALTQPAVSQHVRALETQIGARLIERGHRGFSLTEAGELLLVHADALAERLRLAETQLGESVGDERSRLRVGVFASALAAVVPAAIGRLRAPDRRIEVGLVEGGADDVAAGVRDGSLHVGVCFQDSAAPRRLHPDTERREFLEEPMLACVGPAHRLAGRARVRLRDLSDDSWIASAREGLIVQACRAAGFEPRVEYLTSDPLAIGSLVAAGHGVTLAPRLLAPHLPGIATSALVGTTVRRSIYTLVPTGHVHPLVPEFLDALRAEARSAGE
jgi:DNA-binding transcriptional LysR family regulator